MTTSTEQMCRLVVHGPDRRVELAVPNQVVVADLLPTLVQHLGEEVAERGLAHGGWVLQRAGSLPLDVEQTLAALEVRDGETLHLRPQADRLPPVDFDDLVDGLATGLRDRSGRWYPAMARRVVMALIAVTLALDVAIVARPGPVAFRVATALAVALFHLGLATSMIRFGDDRATSWLVVGAGAVEAALFGLLLPALADHGPVLHPMAPGLLVAVAAVSTYTALALPTVGLPVPFVVAVGLSALLGASAAAAAAFTSIGTAGAAAALALVGTVLLPAVPMTAFRLAGLRLEPLPTLPEHLQENIDPEPGAEVLAQAVETDHYMSALYAGLSLPVVGAAAVLGRVQGFWAPTSVILLALAWVLTARAMNSAWHRLALWAPAAAGLSSLVLSVAASLGPSGRIVMVLLLQMVVALLFGAGRVIPHRRLTPYWGRAGDILQITTTVVLVPAVLAVVGAFGWARALVG